MIGTLARKSLRARFGRNIFIGLAIMLGVSFVAGSFVLADSMKSTFDDLFASLNEDTDLVVRSELIGADETDTDRDPFADDFIDDVRNVDGVTYAEGTVNRYAQMLDQDGEPIGTGGAPAFGVSWGGEAGPDGVELRDGRAPSGFDEVAIDKSTADNNDFVVGDPISIVFDSGQRDFTIVGLVGIGDSDSFGGATASLFDVAIAQELLDADGEFDTIEIMIAEGADVEVVRAAVDEVLPARVEVATGEEVAEETSDAIGELIDQVSIGLLIFAFVTAFISAFIINNVFGITIGQRLRELALLRSVGANAGQVRRMIVIEALAVSVVGTVIGIFGGLLIARFIVSIFNAAGAGFPDIALELNPRTAIIGLVVGIGVTLASVLIPVRRASRIPPVAAMRPELGFEALSANKRVVRGAVITGIGVLAFLVGLFATPGGGSGLALFAGGGALLTFLGVTSLSTTVAHPVSRAIGAPIQRLFGVPGQFARENAARSPRRTARTASALMIGVAVISAASVFASSLRDTFVRTLETAVTADYIVIDDSRQGLPPRVAEDLATVPEIESVSPFRFIQSTVDDDGAQITAIDPVAFPDLVNVELSEGGFDGLESGNGVLVYTDTADDRGLAVGDEVDVTYQNGVESTLVVSGIFDDNSLGANWFFSIDELERVSNQTPRDFFVLARLADGVDLDVARANADAALAEFPQADLQDNSEFRETQEGQINQLLAMITVLLAFAIFISFVGIAITLALSVFERTREIGLLRAVGMTRRQLRRSVRWEAVIVAVFGVIIGVVLGTALGAALAAAVPDNVIDGITLPFGTMIAALIITVLGALVAAWYPARKAARMNVLDAINVE